MKNKHSRGIRAFPKKHGNKTPKPNKIGGGHSTKKDEELIVVAISEEKEGSKARHIWLFKPTEKRILKTFLYNLVIESATGTAAGQVLITLVPSLFFPCLILDFVILW